MNVTQLAITIMICAVMIGAGVFVLGMMRAITEPKMRPAPRHPKNVEPTVLFRCVDCGQDPVEVRTKDTVISIDHPLAVGVGYVIIATCRTCGATLVAGPISASEVKAFERDGAQQESALVDAFAFDLLIMDPVEACQNNP